ncbi:MAG: hypothetical protein WAU05_12025 [Nitrospira sp.]
MVASVFAAMVISAAFAYYEDPFEFDRWTGQGDGTFSLTYLGQGCILKRESCKCDLNDHRFRVNVNRSSNRRDWKFWSGNKRYQGNPTKRAIYGFALDNSNAHVCIGSREFSSRDYPNTYWTTSGVVQNLYAWRR